LFYLQILAKHNFFLQIYNIFFNFSYFCKNKTMETTKCLIIGSGPAGYTAAIYASRASLQPILFEGLQPGGQLTITTDVENFPGYPEGVLGQVLVDDIRKQALRFNTDMRSGIIEKIDLSKRPFKAISDDGTEIMADSVIIATGACANWLGIESEEKFKGMGVSACATCDGFFYKNQVVAVVGGGDTACEEAIYLAGICKKVYLIVRRDVLRASKIMQEKVMNNDKIEVIWKHKPKEILGDDSGVTGILLHHSDNITEETQLIVTGVFIAIGHTPNSAFLEGQLELHPNGYIKTIPGSSKTSVEGVFAAGDVQDLNYRQGITAAGSGCMAAIDAERFLA
jgi:thioredoxin reductase (NADPH)